MHKVIFIALLVIITLSCSVTKRRNRIIIGNDESGRNEISFSEVRKGNLTEKPFIIRKAEIEIIDMDKKQKFFATIRFNPPDKFLISVRTTAAIEVARIFLTNDTILVNDRMNRILYYGTKAAGIRKYGFSSTIFPVLFGDIIMRGNAELQENNCIDGASEIESFLDGHKLKYTISCSKGKAVSTALTGNVDSRSVYLKYYDYERSMDFYYPGRVNISHIANLGEINIRYSKVEIPWSGDIKFIPGTNYEHFEIK